MCIRHRPPLTSIPPRRPPLAAIALVLAALVPAAPATPAWADGGTWTLSVEATHVSVYGLDPHVLNVRETAAAGAPARTSAVSLESDGDYAPRVGARYSRGRWGLGVDFIYFVSKQSVPNRTASSDDGRRVVFEGAGRTFVSNGPGETLFYGVLEDTELSMWTADLFLTRLMTNREDSALQLLVGLRNADFDNDYRAVTGVEGVGGRRSDASSNYGRMMGPLVGLAGEVRWGRNTLGALLGQSLVFGEAELSHRVRDFDGPLDQAFDVEAEVAGTFAEDRFRATRDVAIPISELRLDWSYRLSRRFSLGAGVSGSVWWDVPVPPGTAPSGGIDSLRETTVVFLGLGAALTVSL